MADSPCKNCLERYVGCHSVCQKYINYKIQLEKEKATIKKLTEIDVYQKIRCRQNKDITIRRKHWRRSGEE